MTSDILAIIISRIVQQFIWYYDYVETLEYLPMSNIKLEHSYFVKEELAFKHSIQKIMYRD